MWVEDGLEKMTMFVKDQAVEGKKTHWIRRMDKIRDIVGMVFGKVGDNQEEGLLSIHLLGVQMEIQMDMWRKKKS